ncbi:hypothetical protein M569_10502 [Genlisea aurea]|uniref:Uncharacterized protein n=1 Tax=Genlisea aurea TaxID=192259 RepID=S8CBN3_9LAMI|nr:hypothetical protein M569_10502 [Genlisea aurea]
MCPRHWAARQYQAAFGTRKTGQNAKLNWGAEVGGGNGERFEVKTLGVQYGGEIFAPLNQKLGPYFPPQAGLLPPCGACIRH